MLDNEFLRHDTNAKLVFITLLLMCDRKGEGTFGRELLGYRSGLKPTTAYQAFLRLKKANLVTQDSNNKFTCFSICKWDSYQAIGDSTDDNDMTTRRQPDDNQMTHYKNKEVRIKNSNIVEIQRIYDLFIKLFNKNKNQYKLTPKRKTKIKARLNDAGLNMLEKAIINVSEDGFYNGDNDRGWTADLDFIVRSYEQVERLSNLKEKGKVKKYEW